jgi:hypothetical protein
MAGVFIDIPGVGNVEAKNAATEATLREILKVMQGTNKLLNSKAGKGSGSGGGAGSGAGGDGGKAADDNSKAQKKNTNYLHEYGKAAAIVNTRAVQLISGFGNLATSTMNLMSTMANVGNSVESAASSLNSIPIVGGVLSSVFGAVAGAATKSVDSFQKAASSGATFGGSINQFAKSASAAGMTMADFAGLIASNGESLRLLGGNTADGAARFATLTKEMRSSGVMRSLNDLGYSTAEVNQGMANYMKTTMQGGRNSNMTNAQLVQGTKKYLKEMDMLAKVTGETRAQQEEAQAKLASDAQYQAAMAGMSETVAASFRDTVTGLPGPLRDVAKDIMATGTATTEESQKFTAMMPKSAAMMQDFAAKTQRGEKISQEERNKLNNLMAEEGKQAASQYKDIGRYSKEFATQTNQFTAAANIGKDALKNAANAQDEASAGADGQAAALEKSKQTLAEFSNSMTMALANSGLLDTLMTVFGALASFIQTVVVPIFQVVAPVISSLATSLSNELMPVFNAVGSVIRDNVIPMFYAITDFISDNLIPIGVVVMAALIPALMAAAAATWAVVSPLLIAAAPFIAVGIAVGLLVKGFQMMGGSLSTVTDGIKIYVSMWESLFTFIKFGFATLINKLSFGALGGEMLAEAGEELKAQAAEREALETKIATEMKDNRDKNAADAKKKEDERAARDKKYAEAKYGEEKKAIDKKAEAEAPKASVDYSGPEAMLKSFAAQQGSPLAKAESVKAELKPPTATAGAEATKKSMASESDKKTQDQKAKEDTKNTGTSGTSGAPVQTGAPASTSQSTTDSLLKELNTNMVALLRATRENNRIAEKQLSAQESMGGDLFTNVAA